MNTFNNCIILFGGSSEERLVSVASAQNLAATVPEATLWFWSQDDKIFEISGHDLASHKEAFVKEFKPTCAAKFSSLKDSLSEMKGKSVIIGLHGTEGEDGGLQSLLENHGIKFTGSDSKASALAFDKIATKKLAKANGIPVVDDLSISEFASHEISVLENFFNTHGKVVLKPLANGSSVGLYIVSHRAELDEAIKTIKSKDVISYMCEPFIEGREITVGVWQKSGPETISLPCSEVRVTQGGQFDYLGKYLGKGVEELTPAPLNEAQTKACQELALKMHQIIGCKGYSRTDMILTPKGPIVLEINTLPGLTKASFIPQQLNVIHVNLRDFFAAQLSL